jgi:hypothetical protein
MKDDAQIVIEWAPFTPRGGVRDEEILAAARAVQSEFLVKQKGYIKRELFKGDNGEWVDLVYWTDLEAAEQATRDVAQSSSCLAYFGLMVGLDADDPGSAVHHYRHRESWPEK